MWYTLAATRFPPSETENRGKALRGRELAAATMTAAEIAEAEKLVGEWRPAP